ncbi:MAG: phosphoenolpyruvate--protein phosphotransferase [Pyrinomonadaceae bacterium]
MNSSDISEESTPKNEKSAEIRLKARAVSRGVAIGKIVCLHGNNRQFYRIDINRSSIEPEIERLHAAVNLAKRQLSRIVASKKGRISDSGPGIFESHRMLIEDSSLQSKFETEISEQKVNAEWAIKLVTDRYVARYKAIEDEHLRDRYIDIEDVSERILAALKGGSNSKIPFAKDAIIAARELKPSTLVEMSDDNPLAVITENGGWTSHTFILAREMNWPAVTGVKKVLRRVQNGDVVIVDGYNGHIIIHPNSETLARYSIAATHFHEADPHEAEVAAVPAKTLDRREIRIYVNSETPAVYKKAKRLGAQGVGLYRSEFLFNRHGGFPSENEQFVSYQKIAEATGEEGVKIRTFDLGAEQLLDQNAAREKNPALGLRAVRLGLTYKKLLRTQLRAILRASFEHRIDIVIPMVSGVSEVFAVKQMIEHEREQLAAKQKNVGTPRVGVMIEVPSAVLMVKELVEETDFLCLGTNDLIQYLLAVDRDNETVAGWFRTLHPAVLRAIRAVIDAAKSAGKPVIVCGEMAGSPYYVPVLIGLGATDLSMNLHSISKVRRIIAGIALEETVELINNIEKSRTVEETEGFVNHHIRKNWAHLFPQDFSFVSER